MKIKKTFRLSEDIVELMDHRDQPKYPSREFYLESAGNSQRIQMTKQMKNWNLS